MACSQENRAKKGNKKDNRRNCDRCSFSGWVQSVGEMAKVLISLQSLGNLLVNMR